MCCVLFSAFSTEEIAKRKEIVELLTLEERVSLVLHRLNKNDPLIIELKTIRPAVVLLLRAS